MKTVIYYNSKLLYEFVKTSVVSTLPEKNYNVVLTTSLIKSL